MKKYIRKLVFFLVYHLILKQKGSRVITEKINGFTFKVYPTVFNPRDFISSEIFASFIKQLDLDKKFILDMGCGSGIVSVFAASEGAECVAADINPMAVKSTIENAANNGFKNKITVIESDLFESLEIAAPHFTGPIEREINSIPALERQGVRQFNFIFFNPPYYKGFPRNNFERAFKGGKSLEVIKKFSEEAKNFLAPNGFIYMIISSDADIDFIQKLFILHGFKPEIVATINKFFETFYITRLVL